MPLANQNIRNFSIIAHIDHGKSTLSDRFIQYCGALSDREMEAQVLDSMDLERERGITIKAQSVSLDYKAKDGETYHLNFIDTPGHVDFSYEVSRSLSACEGALLVVDASQGVEAQSVANCYTAINLDLEVVPVLNKIDLPAADVDRVSQEIEDIIGIDATDAVHCSAKTGIGIQDLLEQLVERIPPPKGELDAPLKALIIDSWFDNYLGVVSLVRVMQGRVAKRQKIRAMHTNLDFQVDRVGIFTPKMSDHDSLEAGEVGFIIAGIKDIDEAKVGDTFTDAQKPAEEALEGFQEVQPRVFAGIFPVSSDDYENLRDALSKLNLNDASLSFEPETSSALGFGFRCGFLGMLHMEIIQERLEREGKVNIVQTAPTVTYEILLSGNRIIQITNPADLPDMSQVVEIREPIVRCEFIIPNEYIGDLMKLCENRRGIYKNQQFLSETRQILHYDLPLAEIIYDFFDKIKSLSRGYATMDYQLTGFNKDNLVKIDILINAEKVDALSVIVHRANAEYRGRALLKRLKSEIDRHMFEIPLQCAIGGKIIARESIQAMRKNVTAKCYGGDVSRKRKLLEKQKEGKKRMKRIGSVDIPQEAFMAVLKLD